MIDIKRIKELVKNDKLSKNIKDKLSKIDLKKLNKLWQKISYYVINDNTKKRIKAIKEKICAKKKSYAVYLSMGILVLAGTIIIISNNPKTIETVSKKNIIEISKAEELYYSGQFDEAVNEYLKLQEKEPLEGYWDAKIAEIYSVKGDLVNSKKYLENAKVKGKQNSEVLNYVIFTQFMNKEYKEALALGETALAQFPNDKSLMKTMYTVYMANNMVDKAKAIVDKYPVDVKSTFDLAEYARLLMITGNWEEGYKELREAWYADKDEYKIYDILAQISLYDRDTLLQNITSLSEKNPNDLAYKMWLAKIYSLDEATAEQAKSLISELKGKEVGKIEIRILEAYVLQNLNENDKADDLIQKVIEENKDDYRVLHTAGWFYLNKKNYYTALKYCNESIARNKNYADNYGFLMPEIFDGLDKAKDGEPYFRTAIYMEPYNFNVLLSTAEYYRNSAKDNEKALEYFQLAGFIKPNEPEIKYNMAEIKISEDKVEEAVNLLKECIKLSDDIAKYHRTLGTIYLLNGKPAEAIKEIRYAYGSDQEDILTLNNAGCYYITQDVNFVKAEYNLRKAVEGIKPTTDKYTSDTIKENYKKAKDLIDAYNKGNGNTLKMPDFILFY